jgi:hypothetical protein
VWRVTRCHTLKKLEHRVSDPARRPNVDFRGDNVARLAAIFRNGVIQPDGTVQFTDREIEPDKVQAWAPAHAIALAPKRASSTPVTPTPTLGGYPLRELTPEAIGRWQAERLANVGVRVPTAPWSPAITLAAPSRDRDENASAPETSRGQSTLAGIEWACRTRARAGSVSR